MYDFDHISTIIQEEHTKDIGWYYFDLLVKTGAETPQKQENATL